jgi:hypothetical protein
MRLGWAMVAEERSLARSAAFSGFIYTQQNPALEVLSTPAHPQVTQTVGLTLHSRFAGFGQPNGASV